VGFLKPDTVEFDVDEWRTLPLPERLQAMCATLATQGFGAPDVVYVLYLIKVAWYIAMFFVFAALTPALGTPASFSNWWSNPIAFEKAILWTMTIEVMGLGCGSGPLTGHYKPMFPATRHWLRVGTVRLRPFTWVPFTAGHIRNWFDVTLYAGLLASLLRALLVGEPGRGEFVPILVIACLLGLRDKTIFLAARSEHYLLTITAFLFASDAIAGAKAVQLMLWLGAATSKLTHHFPNVMAVMQSNNPMLRSKRLRKRLYRDYPNDLRGSALAAGFAHVATILEFAFPLTLAFTTHGTVHTIALVTMVVFHLGIFFSIPMGVPLEWNVMFIYSGLVLFGAYGEVRFWEIDSPWLIAILLATLLIGPVFGSLRPDKISFLPSMRYYAGNWAPSAWLFAPGAMERINAHIVKSAPLHREQLEGQIEPGTYDLTMARGHAFRALHLHGRALYALLPRLSAGPQATNRDDRELTDRELADRELADRELAEVEMIDGEMIAGLVLGWNFGDGHLHHEQLLAALQAECEFAPGELRCLFVESQPIHQQRLQWRAVDAATGPIDSGSIEISTLLELQPWGAPAQ
jgi:hypothetical protein